MMGAMLRGLVRWTAGRSARSPAWWGLAAFVALGWIPLARWSQLSALSDVQPQQGGAYQWCSLAILVGSVSALPGLERSRWVLERASRTRFALVSAVCVGLGLLAGTLAALGTLAWRGAALDGESALLLFHQGIRVGVLAGILRVLTASDTLAIWGTLVLAWLLPALLAGWGPWGGWAATVLCAGGWPSAPFGSDPQAAWFLLLAWLTTVAGGMQLASPHAVRRPR